MTDTINFELVSPEAKLVSEPVNMAVMPGEEGEFGVAADHMSLVATLKAGVVELYIDGQDAPRKIFIAGGFADVTGDSCIVLAEEAIAVSEIDLEELMQQIKGLNDDLAAAKDDLDKARIEKRIDMLEAKLCAATGKLVA